MMPRPERRTYDFSDPDVDPLPLFFFDTMWRTWSLGIMLQCEADDPVHWLCLKIGPWGGGIQWDAHKDRG